MNQNQISTWDNDYQSKLIIDLEEYIQEELKDSVIYEHLSNLAPTKISKNLLLEFSQDEKTHAEYFQDVYSMLKGSSFTPKPITVKNTNYAEGLKKRIAVETNDYRKYGKQYLDAPTKDLRDLFFGIRDIEAQHAMRIPILLQEALNQ